MEVVSPIVLLSDAILAQCPQYDRASVTAALESVLAGNPTLLGGNVISMVLGQNNDFTNATITIGNVNAGHQIDVHLPAPIDSLPAALAALASIPLEHVPIPRSDLPPSSRLPFEASYHFVGREVELKALARSLGKTQSRVSLPVVATGLGGIGKTSLVTEFAYRYGVYFQGGVFWLNCSNPTQMASQIAACAFALKIDTAGLSLDEQVQQVMIAWQSPIPRLLIFDNCEDRAILDQWKPTVGGCRVLVTARSDDWPLLTQIRLGLLAPEESRSLLKTLCPRLKAPEADAIAADLGYLPLALHLAGSYLQSYPHHTVDQYRKDLTIAHRSLKGRGALPSPTQHELDIEATFMLSFAQLDAANAIDGLALEMLDGAAWCAHGMPLPRDLVLEFVSDATDVDDAVDGLRRLQQLGLLEGTDAVVLHRLLGQVVQVWLGSDATLTLVEDRVNTRACQINMMGVPNRMLSLEPHLRHMTIRTLDRVDEHAARLANSLGSFEILCGAYGPAQMWLERALAVHEVVLGFDHPETATSLNNLAFVLERQGRYAEAQGFYERALALREAVLGFDHPETATSVNNLAFVLERQGRYAETQGLYERALAVREAVFGPDHPTTARSVNNLAFVLERQGRYAEAQGLYERALAVREAVLGPAHPETAESLNNLAGVLDRQGYYAEAQGLYERSLAVREAVLGPDHPVTALSINNLAFVLERQERYAEAQGLYEQTLAVKERVLGLDHPETATSMNNLAFVLARQKRYKEAQGLYERALAVNEAVFGPAHPATALSMNNLASVLESQEQYIEAQQLYERALIVHEAVFGPDHPATALSMNNLAFMRGRQERYAEAQGLYKRALVVLETILGPNHRETKQIRNNLEALTTRMLATTATAVARKE